MYWSNIETGWNAYKAYAKEQWSKLSDEQINAMQGRREELSSRLQEAYGVSKEEAERQISDWQGKQI